MIRKVRDYAEADDVKHPTQSNGLIQKHGQYTTKSMILTIEGSLQMYRNGTSGQLIS